MVLPAFLERTFDNLPEAAGVYRRIDDELQERTVVIDEPSVALKSTVIPTYQNDLEKGRILPDRVLLRLRDGIQPEGADLFRGTPFWFPLHLE